MPYKIDTIAEILDKKYKQYNTIDFIDCDPISVPHSFKKKQDIEIMGFFAAIFAWGQRKTIISKCLDLSKRMDNSPYEFVMSSKNSDLKGLLGFKHRTFNDTDLLYCIDFMKRHFEDYDSLEDAFVGSSVCNVEDALVYFCNNFFNHPNAPIRTRKHISSPLQKSACKRLNMYLRWMVRKDDIGVDFGIWNKLTSDQLYCPLDLHVWRAAHKLGILKRDKADWSAVIELTSNLKIFDPTDPVKYDFALFGISIEEKCLIDYTI